MSNFFNFKSCSLKAMGSSRLTSPDESSRVSDSVWPGLAQAYASASALGAVSRQIPARVSPVPSHPYSVPTTTLNYTTSPLSVCSWRLEANRLDGSISREETECADAGATRLCLTSQFRPNQLCVSRELRIHGEPRTLPIETRQGARRFRLVRIPVPIELENTFSAPL